MNSMCPPDKGDVRRPGTKSQLYAATPFARPLCPLGGLPAHFAGPGSGSGLAKQFRASGATVPSDICLARTFYRTKTSPLSGRSARFCKGWMIFFLVEDDLFAFYSDDFVRALSACDRSCVFEYKMYNIIIVRRRIGLLECVRNGWRSAKNRDGIRSRNLFLSILYFWIFSPPSPRHDMLKSKGCHQGRTLAFPMSCSIR